MEIADCTHETSGSSNRQSKLNEFYFYLEIEIHSLVIRVQEILNRVLTAKTKSNRRPKNITIAALVFNFTVANCALVETPQNEAAMVSRDHVEFKCKSDQGYRLKWWTQQSPSRQILFDGYSVSKEAQSFCSVENDAPGEFYLNLTIKQEAAQTYICHEPDTNKESSADLIIIIEHEAQCETITKISRVIMTCELEFRGNWAPELEWSYNGTLIIEGVNISIISNKSVSSTLTVPLSTNERNYTCTTRFDIRGKPQWTTSTNIPNYVSKSVVAVEGNPKYSQVQEEPSSASGISVDPVIGIVVVVMLVVAVFIAIKIYPKYRHSQREADRGRKRGRKNEKTEDTGVALAA